MISYEKMKWFFTQNGKKNAIYFWTVKCGSSTNAGSLFDASAAPWLKEVSKLVYETQELPWGGDELWSFSPAPAKDVKGASNGTFPQGSGDITG